MIEIELRDRHDTTYDVDEHAAFVDFPERDEGSTDQSRLEIHVSNAVREVVGRIQGLVAVESYEQLTIATAKLEAHREDGRRVLELLIAWTRRWPQGRWSVAGVEQARRFAVPRYVSRRSVTVDPFEPDVTFIADGARMTEITADDLIASLQDLDTITSWDELLKRESRIAGSGGGSKGRVKKDRGPGSIEDRNRRTDRKLQDDGMERARPREVVGVRVSVEAKTALEASGVKRELIEMIGLALASGRTPDEIRATLDQRSA